MAEILGEGDAARPRPPEVAPAAAAARMLARDRGVTLWALAGSGPGDAIVLVDVEAAATPKPVPKPAPKPGFDPTGMRDAIAGAMARSARKIPPFHPSHHIDLQPATDWLAARNKGRPPEGRLVRALLLIRVTAPAAREHPALNGVWQRGAFRPADGVHRRVVVSLRGGALVAPALRDADKGGLDGLMDAMRDLAARARRALAVLGAQRSNDHGVQPRGSRG
jgi:pyruvate dehydrogenase E2 component (dihydrolipoamide acetyltransferase)